MRKLPVFTVILLCLTAVSTTASAAQIRVRHGDIDLGSAAGRATLDRRITRAIVRACPDRQPSPLTSRAETRRCRTTLAARIAPRRAAVLEAARNLRLASAR